MTNSRRRSTASPSRCGGRRSDWCALDEPISVRPRREARAGLCRDFAAKFVGTARRQGIEITTPRQRRTRTVSTQLATTVRRNSGTSSRAYESRCGLTWPRAKKNKREFLEKLQERFVEMLLRGLEANRGERGAGAAARDKPLDELTWDEIPAAPGSRRAGRPLVRQREFQEIKEGQVGQEGTQMSRRPNTPRRACSPQIRPTLRKFYERTR